VQRLLDTLCLLGTHVMGGVASGWPGVCMVPHAAFCYCGWGHMRIMWLQQARGYLPAQHELEMEGGIQ